MTTVPDPLPQLAPAVHRAIGAIVDALDSAQVSAAAEALAFAILLSEIARINDTPPEPILQVAGAIVARSNSTPAAATVH